MINDRWGYIDKTGRLIVEPKFDWGWKFSEGLAKVRVGSGLGKEGYIDRTGRVIIEPQFSNGGDFSEGLASVEVSDVPKRFRYIDRTGKIVSKQDVFAALPFQDGLAVVIKYNFFTGEKWCYINTSWKVIWESKM